MATTYTHALVGGTFDHFHRGHQRLLETAFAHASSVTIGLSTKELYQHKLLANTIQSYPQRKQTLTEYLTQQQWLSRSTIIPLSTIYGTSLDDPTIDAIIVSEETKPNALQINQKRKEKGMNPLKIISIPLVRDNDALPISSERIRKGEIDRQGNSYLSSFTHHLYELPSELRAQLQQPFGNVLTQKDLVELKEAQSFITSVGDITTLSLLAAGIKPAIAIIDGKTKRHSLEADMFKNFFPHPTPPLTNEAGTITSEAATVFHTAVSTFLSEKTTQLIKVEGEEDLLALPAILLSPLQSLVLYGQQDIGIIAVAITPEQKASAAKLLHQFHFRK